MTREVTWQQGSPPLKEVGGGPRAGVHVLTRSSGGSSLGVAGTWCLGYRQPGML
jgi:hypothetical protein